MYLCVLYVWSQKVYNVWDDKRVKKNKIQHFFILYKKGDGKSLENSKKNIIKIYIFST